MGKSRTKFILKLIEPVTSVAISDHRKRAVVTCAEDCWCWSLEKDLVSVLHPHLKEKGAAKPNKRTTKLPPGSLAFKVASGMPIDQQDVEEYKVVKKWKYRDQIPEVMLPLADKAQERFGSPNKADLFLWIAEVSDWMGAGATVADFMKTAIAENDWGQPAGTIAGYTKTIKSFARKRLMNVPGQSDDLISLMENHNV